MTLSKIFTPLLLLSSALLGQAGVTQKDFTGDGHINVIQSDDWQTAKPEQKVGCLDDHGRFVSLSEKSKGACGVFSRLDDYPWTLSSKEGNCTFENEKMEKNKDSYYGKNDNAWSCTPNHVADIYDGLYTIDGFNYPFLCFGDIACYYDAKRVPDDKEKLPLWQFRWGSQQRGITPGHIMMMLMWEKLGDVKREDLDIPSPRVQLTDGLQISLQGHEARA